MTQVSTGPPTITTHPTSQLTTVSINVTLNCEGTGRGSITYHWQTRNINGGQWSDISNSNNRTLVVRNLESQQYRCIVSNEAGGTRSNIATITLLGKFIFYYTYMILLYNNRNHHSPIKDYCYSITRCHINLFSIC